MSSPNWQDAVNARRRGGHPSISATSDTEDWVLDHLLQTGLRGWPSTRSPSSPPPIRRRPQGAPRSCLRHFRRPAPRTCQIPFDEPIATGRTITGRSCRGHPPGLDPPGRPRRGRTGPARRVLIRLERFGQLIFCPYHRIAADAGRSHAGRSSCQPPHEGRDIRWPSIYRMREGGHVEGLAAGRRVTPALRQHGFGGTGYRPTRRAPAQHLRRSRTHGRPPRRHRGGRPGRGSLPAGPGRVDVGTGQKEGESRGPPPLQAILDRLARPYALVPGDAASRSAPPCTSRPGTQRRQQLQQLQDDAAPQVVGQVGTSAVGCGSGSCASRSASRRPR